MATNEFLPFGTSAGANVLGQSAYAALAARSSGFVAGTAVSEQLNKVWRQASMVSAMIGQFVADNSGNDALDDGDIAAFLANFELAATSFVSGAKYAVSTGGPTAYLADLAPVITSLVDGMVVWLKIPATNTGAATLNLNSLGAHAVVTIDGGALTGGEMRIGQIRGFVYDSSIGKFILMMMPRPATVSEVEAGLRGDLFVSPLTKWTARNAYFSATNSSTLTVSSGVVTKMTNLTTLSGSYFSDGASTYSSSAFTCGPKDAGVWLIGSYLAIPLTAVATIRNYIGINSVTTSFQSSYAPSSGTYGIVQARMLKITSGDQIDIRVFQNSGATADIGGEFFGVRIAS